MFQFAVGLLALNKAEMVTLVREHQADDPASWIPAFGRAAEDALTICEMIHTAQTRLAVAIAAVNVEDDARGMRAASAALFYLHSARKTFRQPSSCC
jgi:hypothetical protein